MQHGESIDVCTLHYAQNDLSVKFPFTGKIFTLGAVQKVRAL